MNLEANDVWDGWVSERGQFFADVFFLGAPSFEHILSRDHEKIAIENSDFVYVSKTKNEKTSTKMGWVFSSLPMLVFTGRVATECFWVDNLSIKKLPFNFSLSRENPPKLGLNWETTPWQQVNRTEVLLFSIGFPHFCEKTWKFCQMRGHTSGVFFRISFLISTGGGNPMNREWIKVSTTLEVLRKSMYDIEDPKSSTIYCSWDPVRSRIIPSQVSSCFRSSSNRMNCKICRNSPGNMQECFSCCSLL